MELPTRLLAALSSIRSAGVITGAGVSAESGIPTYRGDGGIYDDPLEGDRTVEALSGTTLQSDPDRTWRAVAKLAQLAGRARPNPAHHAIVEMERKLERFVLLTQNVDGLHQAAGSRNVIAIHGGVFDTRCMACGRRGRIRPEALAGMEAAPRCDECGGVMRPDAVLFGEMLPTGEVARLEQEFFERPPDLVLVVGTTAMFPYIAQPVVHARQLGRLTVEVNPERTYLSDSVEFFVRAKAGEAMPLIAAATSRG